MASGYSKQMSLARNDPPVSSHVNFFSPSSLPLSLPVPNSSIPIREALDAVSTARGCNGWEI
jgi:hypothetical protein